MGKPEAALYAAIVDGNYAVAKQLLADGANPDSFHNDFPYLWIAARSVRMVKLLLKHGADPNLMSRGHGGQTALGAAIEWKQLAVVKALLAGGANPNRYSGLQNPPLADAVFANDARIVKVLVEAGARDLPCVNGERGRDFASPKIAKLLPKRKKKKA